MPVIGSEDVFEIIDYQTRATETFTNVYYYFQQSAANPATASAVGVAFQTQVLPFILAIQSVSILHTRLEVQQLGSLNNFAEVILSNADGEVTGENMPTFIAAPFRLFRDTKETRSGWKRIAGMVEENIAGDFFEATYLSALQTAANGLETSLTPSGFTLFPCIVGGKYDTTQDPPVLKPPTQWVYNLIQGIEAVNRVTTQNSRKRGRGI